MFNPYAPQQQGAPKPLPPRPQMPEWQRKIQEQAAAAAAQEQATAAAVAAQSGQLEAAPQFLSTQNPQEETSMSNDTTPFNPNEVIAAAPQTQIAPINAGDVVYPEDAASAEDLPAKAGIVDYRNGDGLPTTLSEGQAQQLAEKLNGINFAITLPVEHKEPAVGKDGKQRLSRNGKPMLKKVRVPTNISLLVAGEENLNWALDADYAVKLIAEQMMFRVSGHLAAQSVPLKEGWMFDSAWLSKHFGTSNLSEAIEAELRPWAATKVSTLSAATQQAMCSSVTDAEEIVRIYEYVLAEASKYLTKVTKGKSSKADIAAQLAPITKAIGKYESWTKRAEKAATDGKAAPKPLVIKSLSGETVRGIRAVAGVLLVADGKRQALAEKFAAGTYPPRFTAEDAAEYVAETVECSINLQTVACWLQQVATNMQASEQRKLQKYSEESSAAPDDFDLV